MWRVGNRFPTCHPCHPGTGPSSGGMRDGPGGRLAPNATQGQLRAGAAAERQRCRLPLGGCAIVAARPSGGAGAAGSVGGGHTPPHRVRAPGGPVHRSPSGGPSSGVSGRLAGDVAARQERGRRGHGGTPDTGMIPGRNRRGRGPVGRDDGTGRAMLLLFRVATDGSPRPE